MVRLVATEQQQQGSLEAGRVSGSSRQQQQVWQGHRQQERLLLRAGISRAEVAGR
jgi:hypothetical protein